MQGLDLRPQYPHIGDDQSLNQESQMKLDYDHDSISNPNSGGPE